MKGTEAGTSQADQAALRYAMLSVYYDSLGRQLTSGGAPAMLLPMQVQPMTLEDALARIGDVDPGCLRIAAWRVARSVPVPSDGKPGLYPPALAPSIARLKPTLTLSALDDLRRKYRAGANLFGAALVAHIQGQASEFGALHAAFTASGQDLDDGAKELLGCSCSDFLHGLTIDLTSSKRLQKLQHELGLDVYEYAAQFADAVAFQEWWGDPPGTDMTVYPATCLIRQDSSTLTTRITATALVACSKFETMTKSVDPQCWAMSSDVVTATKYVRGPFDLRPVDPIKPGQAQAAGERRMLEEEVSVSWGFDDQSVGAFRNVLGIDEFDIAQHTDGCGIVHGDRISLKFSLARSVESRILWDQRAGGIVVDQGFMKVVPITNDRWRVTSHKTVLFSNRMPNLSAGGWFDLGQMLNFLAPAALSWWLESELYSTLNEPYRNGAPGRPDTNNATVQDLLDQDCNGADDDG